MKLLVDILEDLPKIQHMNLATQEEPVMQRLSRFIMIKIISYSTLLDVYFGSQIYLKLMVKGLILVHNMRSIIFYKQFTTNLIYTKIKEIEKFNNVSVAAEVYPFQKFGKLKIIIKL